MEKVVCIRSAKVPIAKIWDPELHLACDMNINNVMALENTRMVRTYVEIDPRVRPLIMIVKHWTKARVINEAGKLVSEFVPPLLHRDSCSNIIQQGLAVRVARTQGFA